MSTPAIATCTWHDRGHLGGWRQYANEECRASLGDRLLTVWLPQGAVIRCRRDKLGRIDPWADTYFHWFGRRDSPRKIIIKIRPGVFVETSARSEISMEPNNGRP